jgi:hypothetical protein
MDGLRLWNRLGSAAQVRSSEVGPDGTYLGGGRFTAGRFGGAFEAGVDQDNRVLFPKAGLVPPGEGAVEFWGRLIDPPEAIDVGHRPYFLSGRSDRGPDQDNLYVGFNANNGVGLAGLVGGIGGGGTNYPEQGLYTSRYAETYADILGPDVEAWHHYALVWDEDGLPGVGDGSRPVALYVDGALVSDDWQLYPDSVIEPFGETFGLLENWNSAGGAAIDNLKLWDFAKQDFSDRFVEGFTLVGTPRADRLTGSVAGDDIRGLGGSDTLLGLAGNDLLRGDAGADLLRGGAGRDVLLGGAGDDRLYGECGSDVITDGAGRDALWGGGAADVFRFVKDGQLDRICDFGARDRIDVSAWGVDYDDLRIRDLPDGRVRIATGTEILDVWGRGVDAADMTEDRFLFPESGLVFWNSFNGPENLKDSEFGPDVIPIDEGFAFEPSQHGNGFIRTRSSSIRSDYPQLQLPSEVFDGLSDAGTIEMWITSKVSNPEPFVYGVFYLFDNYFDPDYNVKIWWGDGVSGLGIQAAVKFSADSEVGTPEEVQQFTVKPGTTFHVGVSWDVDGIGGTSDTLRVYRDGKVISAVQETWEISSPPYDGGNAALGVGPDDQGYDKFITDNLKIWDFAKTDFSDRFIEASGYADPLAFG